MWVYFKKKKKKKKKKKHWPLKKKSKVATIIKDGRHCYFLQDLSMLMRTNYDLSCKFLAKEF